MDLSIFMMPKLSAIILNTIIRQGIRFNSFICFSISYKFKTCIGQSEWHFSNELIYKTITLMKIGFMNITKTEICKNTYFVYDEANIKAEGEIRMRTAFVVIKFIIL